MTVTMNRRPALVGAAIGTTLLLAVGAGVLARQGSADPATVHAAASTGDTRAVATPPSSEPQPSVPAADTAADSAPTGVPPSTAAPSVADPAPAPTTDDASSSTPASPAPSRHAAGQRVNPTGADVQAAIAALHQRIPLFEPTDPQLRTFAEAVCASIDQGMSQAQVQSAVQEAVSHIQGASLSAADADFAVRTVVQLRCPGSLP